MTSSMERLASLTPEDAVAAGVAVMDEHGPADWRSRIDLGLFNIALPNMCVLGQVYGSYFTGFPEVFPDIADDTAHNVIEQSEAAQLHGFDIGPWVNFDGSDLDAAWLEELTREHS